MKCEFPVTITNPDFGKSSGSHVERRYIAVPCGKCCACLQTRRKNWFFRLKVESNKCVVSYVVTLTYNDNDVPDYVLYDAPEGEQSFLYHPLFYRDVQLFNKKLRKELGSFRFFCVGEYGSQYLRPHWHICYFFDHAQSMVEFEDSVFKSWFPDSRITIDITNDKAANYILKYCLSMVDPSVPDVFRPIIRCSNRPFIGAGLLQNEEFLRYLKIKKTDLSGYVGYRQRLPRILRDRIFDLHDKLFMQHELELLIRQLEQEKQDKDRQYFDKYGVDRSSWDRQCFNNHIRKISKIKSLQ